MKKPDGDPAATAALAAAAPPMDEHVRTGHCAQALEVMCGVDIGTITVFILCWQTDVKRVWHMWLAECVGTNTPPNTMNICWGVYSTTN